MAVSSDLELSRRRDGQERGSHSAEDIRFFDIGQFYYHFRASVKHHFYWILLLVAICGALMTVYRSATYVPTYRAEAILTVNADISGITNYYNTTTAKQLQKTFPYILTSTTLIQTVKDDLNTGALNASISTDTVTDTNLLTVYVTASNPEWAYRVLCSVIRNYPTIAERIVGPIQLTTLVEPIQPTEPSSSRDSLKYAVRGFAFGLFAGICLLVMDAFLARTVVDRKDVRTRLTEKCIASIPHVRQKKSLLGEQKISSGIPLCDIRNSAVSEDFRNAIRTVRHYVRKRSDGAGGKVVLVTSTFAGEGKTTVAVNLALSLAQSGAKTLLIDMDLRNPSLYSALGFSRAESKSSTICRLTDVLEEKIPYRNGIAVLKQSFGLHVLLSAHGSNASDSYLSRLVARPNTKQLIDDVRREYDYVIVDTAPAGLISDTAVLARYADGVVYVIREDDVSVKNIRASMETLAGSGIKLYGCVINNASHTHSHGYGYSYGYGYYRYGSYSR